MAKREQPPKNKKERPQKGKQPSPPKEESKLAIQPKPERVKEAHLWEEALKEQLAEAKRREEESRRTEESAQQSVETGEVQVGGERFPHSAYEIEESPRTEALRLAVRDRINKYYDERLQVLEKSSISDKPREVLQLAALEKGWVEDPDFSKLFFAKKLKPAIIKYYQDIVQKVEALRKINSALDPEFELDNAFSSGEIGGHDLVAVKEAAEDKITDIQIDRDLTTEAGTESTDAAEETIARESFASYGSSRRKGRDDLIGAVKKIQRRRQQQQIGAEIRHEISDFSDEDFGALQNFIDNPDEFERAKENLPSYLVETIEGLIQEKLLKRPLQEKIRAKTEELKSDWSNLQARLIAEEDPLAKINHNLMAIRAFLVSLEELKQLRAELEQVNKKPEAPVPSEPDTELPEEGATPSYTPLASILEMKFERDAYRLSVKVVARKTIEAKDKALKPKERQRLARKISILSELVNTGDVKLAYDRMLEEGRISPDLDQEIRSYVRRASQKLVRESFGISAKR